MDFREIRSRQPYLKGDQAFKQESPREKRIRRAVKVAGTQLMPQLAKLNMGCMVVMTVICVILEAVLHYWFSASKGFLYLLEKVSVSALICWSFFGIALTVVSLIQLKRLKKGHVETVYIRREPGDKRDPFEPVKDPMPKYRRAIKIAAIGELVLIIMTVIFSII